MQTRLQTRLQTYSGTLIIANVPEYFCRRVCRHVFRIFLATSNAYFSVNSQPIWVKFWILHTTTNPNKVYDTPLNFSHSKSQPFKILKS